MAGCLNDGDEMHPDFMIKVTYDKKPLSGVSFHITGNGIEQFSGITDDRGTVHVPNLAPGLYWLSGDLLGTDVASACFHVSERLSRKAKNKLTYTWGEDAPQTSRIAGRLMDSQLGKGGTPIWNLIHRTDVPIVDAGLKLQDPITHAVYLATSDQEGRFSFEGLPSGTYVLHVEGGSAGDRTYDATNQLIRLDDRATRNFMVFKRRDADGGSCGGTELDMQSN
jgi:hypothetical protein